MHSLLRCGRQKTLIPFLQHSTFIPHWFMTTESDRNAISSNNAGVSCDQGSRFEPHVWGVANCSIEFGTGSLIGKWFGPGPGTASHGQSAGQIHGFETSLGQLQRLLDVDISLEFLWRRTWILCACCRSSGWNPRSISMDAAVPILKCLMLHCKNIRKSLLRNLQDLLLLDGCNGGQPTSLRHRVCRYLVLYCTFKPTITFGFLRQYSTGSYKY